MAKKAVNLTLKIVESVAWGFGPAVLALNVSAVKVDKFGYYFTSNVEWGIAIGVFILSLAYVCRIWRE